MMGLEIFFMVLLIIQFFHSIEELANGFHEKFPLGKMKFRTFLTFEILFLGFWVGVCFLRNFSIGII